MSARPGTGPPLPQPGRGVAVVTGAARGLGEQVALRLAAAGYTLALVGHEPELLEKVAARCGGGALWWKADVTDSAALAAVAAEVRERLGPADVLVVNAGIAQGSSLMLADGDAYDRVLEVNLLGSIRTARAFLAQLVARRGYLLQIASLAALVPTPMMSAYGASKAGVEAYAHAIAPELAHHGVRVAVAYLTWVDTDMVCGADRSRALAAQRSKLPPPFNRTYPLDRAADTLARGILARKRRIYVPGWLRAVAVGRGLLPWVTRVAGARQVAATERALQAETAGPIAEHTGAGGRADNAATSAARTSATSATDPGPGRAT